MARLMKSPRYTFSRTLGRHGGRERGDPCGAVDVAALLRRLHEHATGRRPLKPTQQRAVEIVLDKVLPDLGPSKLSLPGRDEEWIRQDAAHKERSAWHAAHRAKRQQTAECEFEIAAAAGREEGLRSGATDRYRSS